MPSDPSFQSTERESMALQAAPAPLPATPQAVPTEPAAAIKTGPAQSVATDAGVAATAGPSLSGEAPATPLRMLSAAERADLPPLRLSMHVFAEAPERRFVMIDGRRLTEGDQVATDVVLTTIRRDGAVLEIRGHRVLIERP
jgi:general secretion pathway protein B